MDMAFALPWSGEEATLSHDNGRRTASGWGLLASVILHSAVLACVAGWNGGRAEPSPAMDVAVVVETAPPAPKPVAESVAPPSPPSPRHRAAAPTHRAALAPRHAPSAKPAPTAATPQPQPGAPSLSPVDHFTESAVGRTGTASTTQTNAAGVGTASDTPAMPSADNPAPTYPISARHAGREGRTVLRVIVDANGGCVEVQIAVTSGTPSLDEAAVAAVRRWHFTPSVRSGRAVEAAIRVPVVFKLTGAP